MCLFFKKLPLFIFIFLLYSCANYNSSITKVNEKKYFSSSGFALIYDESLKEKGVINKKIDNSKVVIMHSFLKKGTLIKLINPDNSKTIISKIHGKAKFPKIFNVVISHNAATNLQLDLENPYVELYEMKKNKTFVAKEGTMFEEEKNVAEKVPVNKVQVNSLSTNNNTNLKKKIRKSSYTLVLGDFFYLNSAEDLKDEILKKTKITKVFVTIINDKKHRLSIGPFKDFNSLKYAYISLNNLGFNELTIIKG